MILNSLKLFFLFYFISLSSSFSSYFNIAIIFSNQKASLPNPNLPYFHSVLKAFNDINNKNDGLYDDILPNIQLRIILRSSNNQFLKGAIDVGSILQVDTKKGVMASIGPFANRTFQGATPAFQEAGGIPVFNYQDRSAWIGDSSNYPNVLRLVPGIYQDGQVIASLVKNYFGWEKVTVFFQSTDSSLYSNQVFNHFATKYGIKVLSSHNLDASGDDFTSSIKSAKRAGARIFILLLDSTVGVKLMTQGQQLKLFNNGNTQIIGGDELTNVIHWNTLKLPAETLNSLLTGYIGVSYHPYAPPSEMKTKFLNDWVNQKSTKGYVDSNGISHCDLKMDYYNQSYLYAYYPGLDTTKPIKCAGLNYSSYKTHTNLQTELDQMMYGYDSVLSVAYGLHYLIYNLNNTNPTPNDLHSLLLNKNFSFTGLTGKVSYSTEMMKDQLNVGGRLTGLLYNVVNYVPIPTNISSSNVTFKTIINWNSETGFPKCNNFTYYVPNKQFHCVSFEFQTSKNSFPLDSPPPVLQNLSFSYRSILFFLSCVGIFLTLLIGYIFYSFRHRRLVKMNQPILSSMMLLGMSIGFVRVLIAAFEINSNLCRIRLWLEHLAFQLIFGTLVVRCWRVYLVTCTMKRIKVTEKQCIISILLSMIITIGFLIALITTDDKNSAVSTITQNQFEYTQELTCDYDSRNLVTGLYVYELFVLVVGLIFCWLIRNVKSTVSNTSILLEGLITTTTISIGMYIILKIINIDSNTRVFIVGLTISISIFRLLWVFYSQLIYKLFAGYELNRSLFLHKSEKNILELMGCIKLSNRILAINDDDHGLNCGQNYRDGNDKPICDLRKSFDTKNDINKTFISTKGFEKFAKLKNHDELNHEIDRVKQDIQKYQMELACLENMMFASDKDSSSKNTSSQPFSPNPRRYSYESVSCQDGKVTSCGNGNLSGPNVCASINNGNVECNSISFKDHNRIETNDLESQLQTTVTSLNHNTRGISSPLELSVRVQSSKN